MHSTALVLTVMQAQREVAQSLHSSSCAIPTKTKEITINGVTVNINKCFHIYDECSRIQRNYMLLRTCALSAQDNIPLTEAK